MDAKASDEVEVVVVGRDMAVRSATGDADSKMNVVLGEGCAWDAAAQKLLWVDIRGKHVFVFDPKTNVNQVIPVNELVGCVVPRKTGGLVAALHTGVYALDVTDAPAAATTAAAATESDGVKAAVAAAKMPLKVRSPAPVNVFAAAVKRTLLHAAPPAPAPAPAPALKAATAAAADAKATDKSTAATATVAVTVSGSAAGSAAGSASAGASANPNPNRFNDGKCDRSGRLVVGTMQIDEQNDNNGKGSLYSLSPDLQLTTLFGGVTISNGLAWTNGDSVMYYIDSAARCVARFPYHRESGAVDVASRTVAVAIPEAYGWPDGMCIDADGMLWVAQWAGGAVHRWDPKTGKLLRTIRFPTSKISCCCFGGPTLSDLYVTSAAVDTDYAQEPWAGSLFVVRNVGHTGFAANAFNG